MEGISVYHHEGYEGRYVQDFSHARVVRVCSDRNTDTLVFQFDENACGVFRPVDTGDFEEYYLLSGRLVLSPKGEPDIVLLPGDVFTLSDLRADVVYLASEASELFCVSTGSTYEDDVAWTSSLMPPLEDLQERDGDTLAHCERVRALVGAVAHETDFPEDEVSMLQFAARFHDIGKELVPIEILTKPGRLTDEEYKIMKDHSVWSEQIAKPVLGDRVASILRQHHEHVDGTGYPDGLTGDQIEPAAKVIAVADAYDAMVTSRPYHKGISPEAAVVELRRCSGTQFDPEYVEALVRVLIKRGILSPEV
ncbi:MAG: HD-GYP domain-containing protein [Atopobiaceae bacterium]|jgi:HD-GYP domain-containing protein (c-di-GMP phosphodiesterase class II)|nr:HD-GYP domain-containing protein [Atopobiaceae bacterium]MCH4179876.1 HD-GYP domain-containing protein [Atopobiaceae bacterium]MCH4213627.1 HD-GYP domain-containing protein [Atopobiaceae bacterium]MCH4230290.1 HD-GYP domain-containing protein [Atopobiaceae bacterium]MCH4276016.1 HD-GYP domain-containing protein [Atopobiaceae bacterium]